jgi:23S rRNA pseudouridine1911/1915/1917 synthase
VAARLSEQFRKKTTQKRYKALVRGKIARSGTLIDQIEKRGRISKIVDGARVKTAELAFRRVKYEKGISQVEIDLKTGRHHQIRVQLAHPGFPIIGDLKYGSQESFYQRSKALHASSIAVKHPVNKERMIFNAEPPVQWTLC